MPFISSPNITFCRAESQGSNSACWNTEWNVRAEVVDQRSGAQVAVNQGVAIRVWETDASNSCK